MTTITNAANVQADLATAHGEVHTTFLRFWNNIEHVLEYTVEFNNNTGYMDGAVRYKTDLPVGTRFKYHTGDVNNRRVIGVVTPFGNVVMFERYTDGANGVIVNNVPSILSPLLPSGLQREAALVLAFGLFKSGSGNIGEFLAEVIERGNKADEFIDVN